ncbi:MAG: CARDB domain-containing protein [Patescibacteria group bacterium UBA2163]
MNTENNRNQNGATRAVTRVFAVIGFIAIIPFGLWASVSVARAMPDAFSAIASALVSVTSVFVSADETITLSVPSLTVQSGDSFVLSWEHTQKRTEGRYTLSYGCVEGVTVHRPTTQNASAEFACNTPVEFLNANNSVVLTVKSTQNRFVDLPITLAFTPQSAGVPTVTANTLITIENSALTGSPTVTETSTPTRPTTPTRGEETTTIDVINTTGPAASDPNGFVDLSARLIEVGVVDKATGEFTASSTPSRSVIGKRVAARFAIENNGTKTSDQWTFNAVLPTYPSHIYSSPTQQILGPGDRIEFTLGFDSFEQDNEGVLIVNVDPTQRINESNKDNNILRAPITVID